MTDDDIWNQQGRLTLAYDEEAPQVSLPPLSNGHGTGPLRVILQAFVDAPLAQRARMSLQLDIGQTFNDRDIAELLSRADSPLR